MQKLTEASDRKKGRRIHKEKGTSRQEGGSSLSFSRDQRGDNTLLTNGGHHAFIFGWRVGKSFH